MKNFSDSQLQALVTSMAVLLITANEKTTTKEVKDKLHEFFPGIELKQTTVSDMMNKLYWDKGGELTRENKSTNGAYWVYSIDSNFIVDNDDLLSTTDDDELFDAHSKPEADDETNTDSSLTNNVVSTEPSVTAVAATGVNSAVIGKLVNYPNEFLKKLDPKLMIGFRKGNNEYFLTNKMDRLEARKLFKKVTGTKHNDVRTISIGTYLKRNHVS